MTFNKFSKQFLLISFAVLLAVTSLVQAKPCNSNTILDEKLSIVLKDYKMRLNEDSASKIVIELEKLKEQYPYNSTISFWEATVYSSVLDKVTLSKAKIALDIGWELLVQKPTDCAISSFYVLRAHILRQESILVSRNGDKEQQEFLLEAAKKELNRALKVDTENPAALVMAGTELARENLTNESHYIGALMMLEKAKSIIEDQNISKVDIENWNQESIEPILNWGKTKLHPEEVLDNISQFGAKSASQELKNLNWQLLLEDSKADGRVKNWADGKALYYFLDDSKSIIWFRLELYNEIDPENPAISLSFDLDDNQESGLNWYGTNSDFKVDKMVSVGPMIRKFDKYVGYNGITNAAGMAEQKWINDKQGNIDFYYDEESRSYFVGFNINDLPPGRTEIRVIGSVGNNATWNDDIGDKESAIISLKEKN